MLNSETKRECLDRKLFGLPYNMSAFVLSVKKRSVVFLFEFENILLFVVLRATSDGEINIQPGAYRKKFPAQVCFTTVWDCNPLSEHDFRDAIKDNYYSVEKFKFGLNQDQVDKLMTSFRSKKISKNQERNVLRRGDKLAEGHARFGGDLRRTIVERAVSKEDDRINFNDEKIVEVDKVSCGRKRDRFKKNHLRENDDFGDSGSRNKLPAIYVSYIEQFCSTAKIKIVNNHTQIRVKVDDKTIVISKSSVRRDLQFNDEDGCNTPKLGRSGIRVRGVLLLRSITLDSIATTRVYKDHPVEQIIRDLHSAPQTRRMTKNYEEHVEPKKVIQALTDPSWIEAMQDKLLQFKLQKVWTLVDLPYGKRAIRTKWVYRNKKDKRGIVVRNKARLVAQGYTQEEGIDYDKVFTPVARIEAIRPFLAYASFKDFVVYKMDMKSTFLYGKIEEEVYVCQPSGFEDPEFLDIVYKVEKVLYGLHQAPKAYDIIFGSTKKELCTEFEKLMHKKFQMSSMGKLTFFLGLQVTQKDDGIFISQDKYVDEILKKFGFSTMKIASTPMETSKPLMKDENAEDVNVYLYRSMIGSLMYLTSSRPDIMFAVCACVRFQVTPRVSHLQAVKRIFRYLKCQPKLGLWYHKDSPFALEAYTDSGYACASLDRKSTTGGCQFIRSRLISWQCNKQTVVANSTTEAEYVAASNFYGHVLWI
ncbi:putative ribonuclease H-like domain-containing protein [Tanacetum coccineum]